MMIRSDFLPVDYNFIMISSGVKIVSNHLIYSRFKNQMKGNIFCISIPKNGHFLRINQTYLNGVLHY